MPQGGNGSTLSYAEIRRYVRIEKGIDNRCPLAYESSGAEGGNRTRTPLRTQDFKSWASTNSATPARSKDYHSEIQHQRHRRM